MLRCVAVLLCSQLILVSAQGYYGSPIPTVPAAPAQPTFAVEQPTQPPVQPQQYGGYGAAPAPVAVASFLPSAPLTQPSTQPATGVVAASTKPVLNCAGRQDGVYVLNQRHCSTGFWKCVNGQAYEYSCPANLVFSVEDMQCEYKQFVPACGGTRPPPPPPEALEQTTPRPPADFDCSGKTDGHYAKRPCDSAFYTCTGGYATKLDCPPGTGYDIVDQQCEYLAICGKPKAPPVQQFQQPAAPTGYAPSPFVPLPTPVQPVPQPAPVAVQQPVQVPYGAQPGPISVQQPPPAAYAAPPPPPPAPVAVAPEPYAVPTPAPYAVPAPIAVQQPQPTYEAPPPAPVAVQQPQPTYQAPSPAAYATQPPPPPPPTPVVVAPSSYGAAPAPVAVAPLPYGAAPAPVALTPTTPAPVDFDCTGKQDGYYYKQKCTSYFYSCSGRVALRFTCPPNTGYDPVDQICEHLDVCGQPKPQPVANVAINPYGAAPAPIAVAPTTTPAPVDFDCTGKQDGFYAKQACASTFYSCAAGHAFQMSCPAGTGYDSNDKQCEHLDICGQPKPAPVAVQQPQNSYGAPPPPAPIAVVPTYQAQPAPAPVAVAPSYGSPAPAPIAVVNTEAPPPAAYGAAPVPPAPIAVQSPYRRRRRF